MSARESIPDLEPGERIFETDPLGAECATPGCTEPTLSVVELVCVSCQLRTRPQRILPLLEAVEARLVGDPHLTLNDALWQAGRGQDDLRDEAWVELIAVHGATPGMTGVAAVAVVSRALAAGRVA